MFSGLFKTNPFLKRFPEQKKLWNLAQKRAKGFLKFTSKHANNVSSVSAKSAKVIARLNELGFITVDSQEGNMEEKENPKKMYGDNIGQPIANKAGSPATLLTVSERAYCDGFIRSEFVYRLEKLLQECNPDIKVVVAPFRGERINLTKQYIKYEDGTSIIDNFTNVPDYTRDDLQNYVIDVVLPDTGYYEGPPLEPFPLDLRDWSYVSIIDMKYGRSALGPGGLFLCIKKVLKDLLKSEGGTRRRRANRATRKNRSKAKSPTIL
jgi:hypothetical protein